MEIVIKRAYRVTELIVNGIVYAEKKGVIEASYMSSTKLHKLL